MRGLFILSLICICNISVAQSKYITRTGLVAFEASVPSFEDVKAKNETTTCIINTKNGEIAALVFVKGFRFKNALMEEHFNENYIESNKYPKMTFKGLIKDFDETTLANNDELMVKKEITGSLSLHGKTKEVTLNNTSITLVNNTINIIGNFDVKPEDFDIKIPKIVSNKIAETIKINLTFKLEKQ